MSSYCVLFVPMVPWQKVVRLVTLCVLGTSVRKIFVTNQTKIVTPSSIVIK